MINFIGENPEISFIVISLFISICGFGIYKRYKKDNPNSKVGITFVGIVVTLIISIPTIIVSLSQINVTYKSLVESQKQTNISKTSICENLLPKIYISDYKLLRYKGDRLTYLEFRIYNPSNIGLYLKLNISKYSGFDSINTYLPPKESVKKIIGINKEQKLDNNKKFNPNDMVYVFNGEVQIVNKISKIGLEQIGCLDRNIPIFEYNTIVYLKYVNNNRTIPFKYGEKTCEVKSIKNYSGSLAVAEKINSDNFYGLNSKGKGILTLEYLNDSGFKCNEVVTIKKLD